MILRLVVALSCVVRFAPAQSACKPVEGGEILGKHLAAALPEFQRIPADAEIAPAPLPGSQRILHAPELASLAKKYSIDLASPRDVCFEWPMRPLTVERVLEAMKQSLDTPDADIKIVEMSLHPVPPGRIEFPRERLAAAGSPALWRGDVIYGGSQHFAIWARVRIQAPCQRLLAAENIRRGQTLEARSLRQETAQCALGPKLPLTMAQAGGMVANRSIQAGEEIRPEFVAAPNDVDRGDSVHVEVLSGAARLAFTGKAETSGRSGDVVAVRNPGSNRIFNARVEGKDRVIVQAEVADEK